LPPFAVAFTSDPEVNALASADANEFAVLVLP
jgi:hypothetical protein